MLCTKLEFKVKSRSRTEKALQTKLGGTAIGRDAQRVRGGIPAGARKDGATGGGSSSRGRSRGDTPQL